MEQILCQISVLFSYLLDGKAGLWALLCPTGDSTQQANPLSSKYRSLVCQQLHPSCNQASRYPFWTPSRWTPVVIRLVGERSDGSVTVMTGRQSVGAGIVLPFWVQEPPWLLPPPGLNAVKAEFLIIYYMLEKRMKWLPEEKHELNNTDTNPNIYKYSLSLLAWQKSVKFVNPNLHSACLHYVQTIWGKVAWF